MSSGTIQTDSKSNPDTVPSCFEILQACDVNYSYLPSNASSVAPEKVIILSYMDSKIENFEDGDAIDKETYYARQFAIYKINQTKNQDENMLDSSLVKDLTETEAQVIK
ncbi:unnamed protein product [Arctia plantaginis]|uniref:Uncharacterized protein n=1 Tax=Arctia plantaginis TaxID=874455 RepID=A0A8S1BM63_ARCPL|nr:unnamed protein product [Arctia plantaginis]